MCLAYTQRSKDDSGDVMNSNGIPDFGSTDEFLTHGAKSSEAAEVTLAGSGSFKLLRCRGIHMAAIKF